MLMIQTGNGFGFALEALLADGIIGKLSRQNFDRHSALQSGISRSIRVMLPFLAFLGHNARTLRAIPRINEINATVIEV